MLNEKMFADFKKVSFYFLCNTVAKEEVYSIYEL